MQQQHSDVLTCGACQKAFALGDIVKFIQHKVLACNKENYSCEPPAGNNPESGDSDDGGVGVVNSRRPSISAPMKKVSSARVLCTSSPEEEPRCSTPKRRPLPLNLHEDHPEDDELKSRIKEELDSTPPHSSPEEAACKKLRTDVSDAQSNTTNSEPSNYVCSTCKARLHSAWRLVQHVQNSHGIKIYIECSPSGSTSSIGSSPGTSSAAKNQSTSSTCSSSSSGCSSGGNALGIGTPLSMASQPRLGIPTSSPIVEPHLSMHNPFTVGGILRMPIEPPRHHQFPPSSLGPSSGTLFARPSSHNEHHFRMEQLVSEQFRLSQHHSLGLAAAVAAVSGVPPPHSPFGPPPNERPSPILPTSTVSRTPVPPPPPALNLPLEPQIDFYSQRLRQLAGTTSPGAANNGNSSPSSRKLTPPFTSPNNNLQAPVSLASSVAMTNNNNNNNSTANNNINTARSPTPRPQSSTPPSEPKPPTLNETPPSDPTDIAITPRLTSTPPNKPTDFSMAAQAESMDASENGKIHSCEFCGKKFRFQSSLVVHKRTHTGEKPYKCNVCSHVCSQSSKLKRHMKVHKRSVSKTSGGEDGTNPNGGGSVHSTPDQMSNEGSIGTAEDDDDEDEEMDDDEEEEEEEEDDEEEMELEEEEGDEDDDVGGDAPEDLTTKSSSSTPPAVTDGKGTNSPNGVDKVGSGSLVSELMDKYGLSTIQQYSEAYKQALQESIGAHHLISRKDDLLHRSHLLSDNNNKPRLENGLLEKSAAALRFREEFAKNMISSQPPLDLVGGPHGLFGAPFDNPYDASKRLKLDQRDGLVRTNERDSLFTGMWLPPMAVHHRDQMFGTNGTDSDLLKEKKSSSNPSTSATLAAAAAAAAAINLGLPSQNKKETRRNDTCEFCGKVFKNCSNLTVHRRSHTGEKPYKCELCSYACAQSSKLTRHMKTHGRMGKDVYRCRFCEMPFSVPSTLEKHMRKCVVNQNIKVEYQSLPSMLSGDEDSAASTPKDAATT
ncbi:B-cell lymphoma/leukemia 11A isoform X2 [Cimex lectularius]|nr:B-cell lymphoma/leukemia 11A isoform X2 [Cimex lectularius]XP_024085006.1 B-cell lymphoma/leukemia 11A isoform X2 [Cimex lectularius]